MYRNVHFLLAKNNLQWRGWDVGKTTPVKTKIMKSQGSETGTLEGFFPRKIIACNSCVPCNPNNSPVFQPFRNPRVLRTLYFNNCESMKLRTHTFHNAVSSRWYYICHMQSYPRLTFQRNVEFLVVIENKQRSQLVTAVTVSRSTHMYAYVVNKTPSWMIRIYLIIVNIIIDIRSP